ncbi:MAG: ribokinase [Armatimonadota bacterium]
MSRAKLVVVGSSNIDMVVKAERIPQSGETLLGDEFLMVAGGKGANQAVCAGKLGAEVYFVGRIGSDVLGDKSIQSLEDAGVNTKYLTRDPHTPGGVALITIDKDGHNAIVVAPGANYTLSKNDIDNAKPAIKKCDYVVLQLEIPWEVVEYTIKTAKSMGKKVILNPAPIRTLDKDILKLVDVITPNEHEAADIVGCKVEDLNPEKTAELLAEMGIKNIVITLGSKGAFVYSDNKGKYIEAKKVKAVDTTAAGDSFTASLTCGLSEGMDIFEACEFAAKVASIVVTRMGAQSSMPDRNEVG